MLHAIIMAGGRGARLWPESTPQCPKPFLKFQNDTPMIRVCYDSLFGVVDASRINIVANSKLVPLIHEAIPTIRLENIIQEPVPKNTAPCIGLAALFLLRNDPDATMIVLPSDHVIESVPGSNEKGLTQFRDTLRLAADLVEESPEHLVTIGAEVRHPSTAFGYLEMKTAIETSATEKWKNLSNVYEVEKFLEKPDLINAQGFQNSGRHLWNMGIFVWKARRILELINEFHPELGKNLKMVEKSIKSPDFPEILESVYRNIDGISIDYAVMEYAKNVVAIKAPFYWNDMGNWNALGNLKSTKQDDANNVVSRCQLYTQNSSGNIVRSGDPNDKIVLIGVDNLIIIQSKSGLLVANRENQDEISDFLTEFNKDESCT